VNGNHQIADMKALLAKVTSSLTRSKASGCAAAAAARAVNAPTNFFCFFEDEVPFNALASLSMRLMIKQRKYFEISITNDTVVRSLRDSNYVWRARKKKEEMKTRGFQ